MNKSTAWIHNCVSSALLYTQRRREEGIDSPLYVYIYQCWREREREREATEAESRLINNGDNSITMRKRGEGVVASGARYSPMSSSVCVAA